MSAILRPGCRALLLHPLRAPRYVTVWRIEGPAGAPCALQRVYMRLEGQRGALATVEAPAPLVAPVSAVLQHGTRSKIGPYTVEP